jgi:hypothetical protein
VVCPCGGDEGAVVPQLSLPPTSGPCLARSDVRILHGRPGEWLPAQEGATVRGDGNGRRFHFIPRVRPRHQGQTGSLARGRSQTESASILTSLRPDPARARSLIASGGPPTGSGPPHLTALSFAATTRRSREARTRDWLWASSPASTRDRARLGTTVSRV